METNILCLANSKKYNQRCIAGIEVRVSQTGVTILHEGNNPKWIRPVSNCEHGEIDSRLVDHINLLDIFKIHVTENCPDMAQTENVYFIEDSIEIMANIEPLEKYLSMFCAHTDHIFGNDLPYITQFDAYTLDHSLIFICVDNFSIYKTETYKGNLQLRAKFIYGEIEYDLPITDIDFINKYRQGVIPTTIKKRRFLTISLGTLFKGKHYKLIAGVILPE